MTTRKLPLPLSRNEVADALDLHPLTNPDGSLTANGHRAYRIATGGPVKLTWPMVGKLDRYYWMSGPGLGPGDYIAAMRALVEG